MTVAREAGVPVEERDRNAEETRRRSKRSEAGYSRAKKIALTAIGLALFIFVWEVAALSLNNNFILPTPLQTANSLSMLFQGYMPSGAIGSSSIYSGIWTTLVLIAEGFAISLVGVPLGFLMGRWKAAETIIDPWINAFYAIPMVAIVPLIYVAVGGDYNSDIVIVVLMTVFMITLNTFQGVRYVSSSLVEVGQSLGASEWQLTRHIILPAAMPDIYAGLRIGLGRAVLGAIIAEALLSTNSLGYLMISFVEISQTSFMVATIVVIAAIGFAFLNLPRIAEKWLFKWKEGERLSRGT